MLAAALLLSPAPQAPPPNIVVILADDLGYGDLGCYGGAAPTPNLDRMALEGVRFTDFHACQAVCSPSRAGLLTGCYPNRLGLHGALDHGSRVGIDPAEETLPELLKGRGYATAMVGKWHIGHRAPFLPTRQGFDSFFGLPWSHDMWERHPEAPAYYQPLPLYEGERVVDPRVTPEVQAELLERFTARAEAFVREKRGAPFFLYLAYHAPHVPLYPGRAFQGRTGLGAYADTVAELDAGVGRVLRALRETGQDGNTLVIFTSDNGPWLSYGDHAGGAGPYREGKGTTWNGGTGVPFIARWPGRLPAGTVQPQEAMAIDLLPTLAAYAGAALPSRPIDGRDIRSLLRGGRGPERTYLGYYAVNELQSLRRGRWKLVLPHAYRTLAGKPAGGGGIPAKYGRGRVEAPALYDVRADPGETLDLAAREPRVLARLLRLAEAARADLGDSLSGRTGKGARPGLSVE
jgi:arylsulfatase A-like enzyme